MSPNQVFHPRFSAGVSLTQTTLCRERKYGDSSGDNWNIQSPKEKSRAAGCFHYTSCDICISRIPPKALKGQAFTFHRTDNVADILYDHSSFIIT